MGAPGEVRLARPDKPDAWMLSTENKTVRVACAKRSVTFAPIRVSAEDAFLQSAHTV